MTEIKTAFPFTKALEVEVFDSGDTPVKSWQHASRQSVRRSVRCELRSVKGVDCGQ